MKIWLVASLHLVTNCLVHADEGNVSGKNKVGVPDEAVETRP